MPDAHAPRKPLARRAQIAAAALALFAVGGGAGAVIAAHDRPQAQMAPLVTTPIRALPSEGIVTLRGRVDQIYGAKFVIADASGRALVETGRAGERTALVALNEPVLVQGRFERGFLHAAYLIGPDRRVVALDPGPGGPDRHHGPHGPRDEDGPPSPLPGAAAPPATPAASATGIAPAA